MLPKLARGLFLAVVLSLIAAYTVSAATSSPPPVDPNAYEIQWC